MLDRLRALLSPATRRKLYMTLALARTAIGATYRVACRITTSGGNIDERTKKIMVRNR